MNVIELLRQQFKDAHESLEATMADVTEEVANFRQTKKAMPVGAAYAHAILSEDMILSTMLAHKDPIVTDKIAGLSEPMPDMEHWDQNERWYTTVTVDVAKMKALAQKVYQATDDYLAALDEEAIEEEIDIPGMGKKPRGYIINNFLLLHVAHLTGEISAAKGFQGKKGYPW